MHVCRSRAPLRRAAAAALLVVAAACTRARPDEGDALARARAELLEMGHADQQARARLTLHSLADTALLRRMSQLDSMHTRRLQEIVRAHGWPGKSTFGEPAAQAAFLIVQHSPSHEFKKEMLELLRAAAEAGEARASDAAMLADRVLTGEGQPQRYGTQFHIRDGRLVPHAIEDPARLDERRAQVGLPPMAEYVARLRETYRGPVDFDTAAAVPEDSTRTTRIGR